MAPLTERFEMRLDTDTLAKVDDWRTDQPDLPTRSEAMRRLVELGLQQTGPSRFGVSLSDGERLIIAMLADMQKGLNLGRGEIDTDMVSTAIAGGHLWALKWRYQGVYPNHTDSEQDVTFVGDVLDMWSFIEDGMSQLTADDRATVSEIAGYQEDVKFPGFDGNNEAELLSIALFRINTLGQFVGFANRNLNSHCPMRDRYRKMLAEFTQIRPTLGYRRPMAKSQLISLLTRS